MNQERPELTVRKYSAYLPISTETALDAGLISEDEARDQGWSPPARVRIPWRSRIRYRFAEPRERVALAWRVLAGDDVHRDCE